MSRLESFIRRLDAQRRLINDAIDAVADIPGIVLELGLGNGRTYDHIREKLPGRDIYVFERAVAAHPDCIPPDDRLYLGNVIDSLAEAVADLGPNAILVHSDIGTGDAAASIAFGKTVLGPALRPILKAGARIVSDQPLCIDGAVELDKPSDMDRKRYYIYVFSG